VNNRLVPLKTRLSNGDIVEIITGTECHPRTDWLKYVVTATAKSAIRKYLRLAGREKSIVNGKTLIKKQLRKLKIPLAGVFESEEMSRVAEKLGFKNVDDMLAAVGFGELTAHQIVNRFVVFNSQNASSEIKTRPRKIEKGKTKVTVNKFKNIEIHVARCCEPIPGEEIVGFITRGRGITIHATRCQNIKKLSKDRILKAEWEETDKPNYPVRIVFTAYRTPNLLQQLIKIIVDRKIQIISQNMFTTSKRKNLMKGEFQIELTDMQELNELLRTIKEVPGVISVDRVLSR
jgi:GTP pyrophosphokinase